MDQIYLDYNATTPIAKEVADAMKPYLDDYFGNPSSIHSFGTRSKLAVENARKQVAGFLGCDSSEIIFTSGGTESNNLAIKGYANKNRHKGKHIVTTSIEHPAVYEVCKYLENNGFQVSYLPVDDSGLLNPEVLLNAIRNDTILISVMHANNEVGTIQPIKEIAQIASEKGIAFHTDAAQSAGKIECKVSDLGVDLLSLAGHKIYGPKGVGALYVKNGLQIEKLLHGADHEQNLRAGTENVLEIVGLGLACEIAGKDLESNAKHYSQCRDHLSSILTNNLPGLKINGDVERMLPNTLSISFPRVEANTLVSRLNKVACSAGAACHAESIDVSAVLEAMLVPLEYAMGTVRFSTGRENTIEQIDEAAEEIIKVVSSLLPDMKQSVKTSLKGSSEIKLTKYTHGLGCACKIEPQKLEAVLKSIPFKPDLNVLVGTETSDDATVYRLSDNLALVQTLDFFTPIVDDPYHFGAIAAANALSDIYAMGALPIFALNIVGFPEETLPMSVLEDIMRGASDKATEAGINVLGGHTIEDPEPKYGMVVSGIIDPDKIIRNHGARSGDVLILTKPIGTGILSTALKRGMLETSATDELISLMSELNKKASEIMLKYDVSACTDVTGFGLLGHLREMSKASKADVEIYLDKVPVIEGSKDLITAGIVPGGTHNNLDWVEGDVDFGKAGRSEKLLLSDAQTSGGLLIAVCKSDGGKLLNELISSGINKASIIGSFREEKSGKIFIT